MVKVIDGKRYNTETATLVYCYSNGYGYRDFQWREKSLYRTPKGIWFIKHVGGAMSDMARSLDDGSVSGGSDIEPVTPDDAFGFLQVHSDESDAAAAIAEYFADRVIDA